MARPVTKKAAIIQAAVKLFAERGIEGTTTREIALLSKTAEGTLFRHFESKEDLAWQIYHENLLKFMEDLEADVARADSTRAKLGAMIERCYLLYENNPTLCTFLLLTEHSAARRMSRDYRTPIQVLIEVIEAGRQSGELGPLEPALAAALAFGAVLRVPIFKVYGRLSGDLREKVDAVTTAVWNMLRA